MYGNERWQAWITLHVINCTDSYKESSGMYNIYSVSIYIFIYKRWLSNTSLRKTLNERDYGYDSSNET